MSANQINNLVHYDAVKKSVGVTYLLWFFLGGFGGHRFYLKRTGSAVGLLILTISSYLLTIVVIGIFGLIAVGIWLIVDAFLIPGMVEQFNLEIANKMNSAI